ncbi:MAG: hypothetical protein EHM58_02355, partial [Ignavibacteriae bacterium]
MKKFTISITVIQLLIIFIFLILIFYIIPINSHSLFNYTKEKNILSPKSNESNTVIKTWIGAGSGGAGTDFNDGANWSPAGTPGLLDDCVMSPTSAATVSLNANISINSLSITYNTTNTGTQVWTLDMRDFALTINGDLTAANNTPGTTGTRNLQFRVGLTANNTDGALIVGGNASLGVTGNRPVVLTGVTTSRGRYEFQGNVTFGADGETSNSAFPYRYVFSKPSGTQTLTVNNNSVDLSAVEIGNGTTSFPTLTLAGSQNAELNAAADRNYLMIYSGSTLDMGTRTFNASSTTSGDSMYLYNSATIKVGGTSGGISGSNFPNRYRTYFIYPNSTVMFNGTASQSINLAGTYYNLTIDNSAGVSTGVDLTINSNLFLSKGTFNNTGDSIDLANGCTITRDIGTITIAPIFFSSVNVTYTGTTAVTTGRELPTSNKPTVLNNLTIEKSGGVTLDSNRTVNGIITFTSGKILTGTKTLTLGASGSVTGETSSSYLVGYLKTTRVVGTGSSIFGGIGVEINSGSDNIGNVEVIRASGSAGVINVSGNQGIARSWNITPDFDPTTSGRILTFSWVSADDNAKDMTQAQIWRKINAGNYDILSSNQNVSGSDPRIITSYSTTEINGTTWTVSDPSSPLPVELISFDAFLKIRNVELKWVTASEINNQGFNIERRSFDKSSYGEWKSVGFVNGKGTTNENQYYSYEDKDLPTGKYQYRLKQVDFNSNYEYFVLNSPSELVVGKPIAFEVSQ